MSARRQLPVRIGIIGAGSIARLHFQAYRELPELVELRSIHDVAAPRAEALHELAPDATVWADLEAMLQDSSLDAVDVCVPHDEHARVAILAAGAGKSVFLEKPMAVSRQECSDILQAVSDAGVTLQIGQHLRFVPSYAGVKDLVASGRIGSVWLARADCLLPSALTRGAQSWWGLDGRVAGGGVGMMQLVHQLDLFRFVLGEVASVEAHVWRGDHRMSNGAEDRLVATLEFVDGAVGHLVGSYVNRGPHLFQMVFLAERGSVFTRAAPDATSIQQHQAPAWQWMAGGDDALAEHFAPVSAPEGLHGADPFGNELAHFARCWADGSEPLTNGADNARTMDALFAIYEAADSGERVKL